MNLLQSAALATMFLVLQGNAMPEESPRGSRPVAAWDTYSDTWVATDALGRRLPGHAEAGPPREDRWVGLFYFLWLGAHVNGGPWDNTRIVNIDPDAMTKEHSPLWGPLHAPHHWGEPLFGYYLSDDRWVLRKHAQMLAAAGVDTLIFDTSNQVIYEPYYTALFETLAELRAEGNATPCVAFLTSFGDPGSTVRELYEKIYKKGLFEDLWFRWEGKPLILADPALIVDGEGNAQRNTPVALEGGHSLGQSFTAPTAFGTVRASFPTWASPRPAMTLTLRAAGPKGTVLAERRFATVADNVWSDLVLDRPLPPGAYYLEMSHPQDKVGWWSHTEDVYPDGQAYADGVPVAGDRTVLVVAADPSEPSIHDFFTFRAPQPDYFQGPVKPNMWSWLEVYPQHVFRNAQGEKEQMSVGVAQNAVRDPKIPSSNGHAGMRVGTLSEEGSLGRNFHDGDDDPRPDAVQYGFNFAEQWERALKEDPLFVFVTGWNEWYGGRFNEFIGVREPVMFVDTFNQEHSRDIEPMKGGHGDNYYYQMVNYIRRYKGVRPLPRASTPKTIDLKGPFSQWKDVGPEFRDTLGDTANRDHPGYNTVTRYRNTTGRNDLALMKVARDPDYLYFYARTQDELSPYTDPDWMTLFINTDGDPGTGWEGYNLVVNRRIQDGATSVVEHTAHGWNWQPRGVAPFAARGNELMVAIPRALMGLPENAPVDIEFKWADNFQTENDMNAFTLNGDAAPFGRFNYRYRAEE